MNSPYVGDLLILATDKDQANILAAFFAAEPGDDETFNHAAQYRAVGDIGAATHFGGVIPVKANVVAAVTEFNTNGPYTLLNGVGLTNGDVADFKSIVEMVIVPRGTGLTAWLTFVADRNLEKL